jgi:hypothetical protein
MEIYDICTRFPCKIITQVVFQKANKLLDEPVMETDRQTDSRMGRDISPDSTVWRKDALQTFISSLSSAHAAPMSAALDIPRETSG